MKTTVTSYALTEKQVEQLAHAHSVANDEAVGNRSTYLRVLITACQAALPPAKKRLSVEVQSAVLEDAREKYYAAVLRGVTTAEVAPDPTLTAEEQIARAAEVRRRATFARSAASTLRGFVLHRGDIRTIDVQTITKAALRAAGRPPTAERELHAVQRAQATLVRIFTAQATKAPEAARAAVEGAMDALRGVLEGLDKPAPRGHRLGRALDGVRASNGHRAPEAAAAAAAA